MSLSRRTVLAGGIALALPIGAATRLRLVGAATTKSGQHLVVGFDGAGNALLRAALPGRAHEVVVAPGGQTLFVAPRRPGTVASVIDFNAGKTLRRCEARAGRHFYGHAVYSGDGNHLFTTENDYASGRGIVAVRDAASLRVEAEFDSGGIGPHQLAWLADGRTLAVANGGIRTHPSAPRQKLNLATMRPNLSLVDAASGRLIDQAVGDHPQASIRHLAATPGGDVVVAMQYEGPPADDVPLVALYRPTKGAGALEPLSIPLAEQRSLKQYTASVAVDAATGNAAVTCPRANRVTFWDTGNGRFVAKHRLGDCGGVAVDALASEFVVSSGRGALLRFDTRTFALAGGKTARQPDLKWDNHLAAVASTTNPPVLPRLDAWG